jgi:hypothetical protein
MWRKIRISPQEYAPEAGYHHTMGAAGVLGILAYQLWLLSGTG